MDRHHVLTEPHCGTDLGLLRSEAKPDGDEHLISGGEESSSHAGEHNMVDNIVHLVLARLPDAPAGTARASACCRAQVQCRCRRQRGERNRHLLRWPQHKMGIHSNATAQIVLERRRRATLMGQPPRGPGRPCS